MVQDDTIFHIPRLAVGIGICLAILVVALSLGFHFASTEWKPTIVFFGAGLAAMGAVAGAFYTGRILRFYRDTFEADRADARRREQHAEDRANRELVIRQKEAAFRFGERWNNPNMFHTRKVCRDILRKRKEPEAIRDELLANDDFRTNANNVLNFLEELALAIREKMADEAIVKRQFGGLVLNLYRAMSAYRAQCIIDLEREEVWIELKWLFDQWSTPKHDQQGKVVP